MTFVFYTYHPLLKYTSGFQGAMLAKEVNFGVTEIELTYSGAKPIKVLITEKEIKESNMNAAQLERYLRTTVLPALARPDQKQIYISTGDLFDAIRS